MDTWRRRDILRVSVAGLAGVPLLVSPADARGTGSLAAGPFMVRDGESRGQGPLTIGGQRFAAALVSGTDVQGRFCAMEIHTPPGRGPEMHVHSKQNEWFMVQQGSIGLQCGNDKVVLKAGDSFLAPLGVPHAYVTLGAEVARLLNLFDPAAQIEAFFVEYAAALNQPGPPDPKRLAAVYQAHGMHVVGSPLRAASFSA